MTRFRRPSYVTFSQRLEPRYWPGWDPATVRPGQTSPILRECVRRYEAAGGEAIGAWMIEHDQDVFADGTPKPTHVHGIIQQGDAKLCREEVGEAIGFEKGVVRSPSRGGRIENAQAYLTHAKDPGKHQYGADEVVTVRGRSYGEIEQQHRAGWSRRAVMGTKEVVPPKEWAELVDVVVQRVLDGEIDELDILRDRVLGDVYARGAQKIDLALRFRARRDMYAEVEKLRAEVFTKTPVWIMGRRQQGKSWLAESAAAALAEQTGWKVFRATAKNGLDDYNGEQIFLLNEPSSRVMEWADFLVLLDPRHAGPLSARFYNKPDSAPRVILIAVSIDPVEFGFFMPGKRSSSDSLDQLFARLALRIEAEKVDGEPAYSISRVGEVPVYPRSVTVPGIGPAKPARTENLLLGYGDVVTVEGLPLQDAVNAIVTEVAHRSPDAGLVIEGSLVDDQADVVQSRTRQQADEALADTGCRECEQRVLSHREMSMYDGHKYWCDHAGLDDGDAQGGVGGGTTVTLRAGLEAGRR